MPVSPYNFGSELREAPVARSPPMSSRRHLFPETSPTTDPGRRSLASTYHRPPSPPPSNFLVDFETIRLDLSLVSGSVHPLFSLGEPSRSLSSERSQYHHPDSHRFLILYLVSPKVHVSSYLPSTLRSLPWTHLVCTCSITCSKTLVLHKGSTQDPHGPSTSWAPSTRGTGRAGGCRWRLTT